MLRWAYHTLLKEDIYRVTHLLTTLSEEHERVFTYGLREKLLDMQAERMKLPLLKVKLPASPDDTLYKQAMQQALSSLKNEGVGVAGIWVIFSGRPEGIPGAATGTGWHYCRVPAVVKNMGTGGHGRASRDRDDHCLCE